MVAPSGGCMCAIENGKRDSARAVSWHRGFCARLVLYARIQRFGRWQPWDQGRGVFNVL